MKHLLIVNPAAGGKDRTQEVSALAASAFANRADSYKIYVTRGPMDAAAQIRKEASNGEELRVYACGGDGTFNECVCAAAELPNTAVCPFPVGTGNDFCRMFGQEADLYRDLPALLDGSVHPIDVVDCNGRYCVNICSAGIDARVGTDVHKYSGIPLIGGATGYVVSLIVNLFAGINREMEIHCGDYSDHGSHALVCVCNGRYYGGGFNPSKYARPDDGILDIYIAGNIRLYQLPALLGKYASGRADELTPHIIHLKGTEIDLRFKEQTVINLDGEAVYTDHASIRLLPHAVNLIVPAGMKFFSGQNS